MITAPSNEWYDQVNAARLAERQQQPNRIPDAQNVPALEHLGVGDVLHYRHREFWVPPVPHVPGVRLQKLQLDSAILAFELASIQKRLKEWAEGGSGMGDDETIAFMQGLKTRFHEVVDQMHLLYVDAVGIFHSLVRPLHPWDRLTWRWRGNPFVTADPHEIGELFSFFCTRRMTAHIRHPLMRQARSRVPRVLSSTPSMT